MRSIRRFFSYASQGRWQAITGATLAALLCWLLGLATLVFPPLFVLAWAAFLCSAAVVVLTLLRQGLVEALLVALGPVMLWLSPVFMSSPPDALGVTLPADSVRAFSWLPFVTVVVTVFAPAMFAAWLLRESRSQGVGVIGVMFFVAALATCLALVGVDPAVWVYQHMRAVFTELQTLPEFAKMPVLPALGEQPAPSAATGWLIGFQAVGVMNVAVVVMLIGRWAQAMVDNPGGFGTEFRALRLDWRVAVVGGGLALLSLVGGGIASWAVSLLLLVLCGFVYQALAVMHALVRKHGASRGWLAAGYALLVLPWTGEFVGSLAALTGVVDCWVNIRARAGAND